METGKKLLAALASVGALALATPSLAQPMKGEPKASATEGGRHAREIDRAMLQNLLKRRAAVAQSAVAAEDKRAALEFLDRQIARVRNDLES